MGSEAREIELASYKHDHEYSVRDRQKFIEYAKAHAADRSFISRDDERNVLRTGVSRFDINYDEARWLLLGILAEKGVALERELDIRIEGVLKRFADSNDKISKSEFEDAVEIYRDWSNKEISQAEVKKKLKAMIGKENWKAKRNGFLRTRAWFKKIVLD